MKIFKILVLNLCVMGSFFLIGKLLNEDTNEHYTEADQGKTISNFKHYEMSKDEETDHKFSNNNQDTNASVGRGIASIKSKPLEYGSGNQYRKYFSPTPEGMNLAKAVELIEHTTPDKNMDKLIQIFDELNANPELAMKELTDGLNKMRIENDGASQTLVQLATRLECDKELKLKLFKSQALNTVGDGETIFFTPLISLELYVEHSDSNVSSKKLIQKALSKNEGSPGREMIYGRMKSMYPNLVK